MSSFIFRNLNKGIRIDTVCMVMRKVTPKIQCKWKELVKKLSKQYPSRNRGYSTSHKRVYAVIANMYGVHERTVYQYLSPVRITRLYGKEYKKVIRHVDNFLPQVFNSKPELSLRDISARIDNLSGIYLKERTLEKILGKYESKPRGPPVIKTESGNYQLNSSFYNS